MQPQAASPPFLTGNGTLNKLAGIDFKQLSLSQKLNENQSGEVRRPVVPWDRVAAPVQITALSAGCGAQNWGTTAWWVSTSGRVALTLCCSRSMSLWTSQSSGLCWPHSPAQGAGRCSGTVWPSRNDCLHLSPCSCGKGAGKAMTLSSKC